MRPGLGLKTLGAWCSGRTVDAERSFEQFNERPYFSALDGLRALSIALVILHHSPRFGGVLSTLQENGRYGVGCFFVISGFLIATLLLREARQNGRINLWKFYGRRAARLLPLYYVVLLMEIILVFVLHQYSRENQELFVRKLPSYLFYYSNWLPTMTQGPFFCSWSLAVEEQFYLAFGALLLLFRPKLVAWFVLAAFGIKVVVYQVFGAVDANSQALQILFSYREPILLGVLSAFLLNARQPHLILRRWFGSKWAAPVAFALLCAGLCLHPMKHESAWDSQLLYLVMLVLVVALVLRPATPVLSWRLPVHIGKISYGIYLMHMFVMNLLKRFLGVSHPLISFVAALVIVVVLATVVHRYFEQPIINHFKSRLSVKPARKPAVQPGETQERGTSTEPAIAT